MLSCHACGATTCTFSYTQHTSLCQHIPHAPRCCIMFHCRDIHTYERSFQVFLNLSSYDAANYILRHASLGTCASAYLAYMIYVLKVWIVSATLDMSLSWGKVDTPAPPKISPIPSTRNILNLPNFLSI